MHGRERKATGKPTIWLGLAILALMSVSTGCETVGDYCATARAMHFTVQDKAYLKQMSRGAKEGVVYNAETYKAKCL